MLDNGGSSRAAGGLRATEGPEWVVKSLCHEVRCCTLKERANAELQVRPFTHPTAMEPAGLRPGGASPCLVHFTPLKSG